VNAKGEVDVVRRGDWRFGAVQLHLGHLGVITEMTVRTVPQSVYTCEKLAVDESGFLAAFPRWNAEFPFCKAWWFPEARKAHVWCVRDATSRERFRFHRNGDRPVVLTSTDRSMNHTVRDMMVVMRRDTRSADTSRAQFRTVTRFMDYHNVTGDIYDLQKPPDWTNEFGQTPTDWPDFTAGKSQQFTVDQINTLQDAVTAQIQPNGDTTYQLNIHYDGMYDWVVAETNAPASVTDPLATQYEGKLEIKGYTLDELPPAKCTADQITVGKVLTAPAAPAAGFSDAATQLQWQQVQALADYNCAIAAFDDPDVGPVIIFPSDYTGDINELQKPPGWTSEYGEAPASWPTPTTGKSQQFTLAQITDIQDAVIRQVSADGDTTAYNVAVRYDGMKDQVVVDTDAPASVTDPLLAAYPNKVLINAITEPTSATGEEAVVGG